MLLTLGSNSVEFSNVAFEYSLGTDYSINSFSYFSGGGGETLLLEFPGGPSITFAGSSLCSTTLSSSGELTDINLQPANSNDLLVSSSVGQLATITPEPSSIALLRTGMLGVAGVIRKRFANARGSGRSR